MDWRKDMFYYGFDMYYVILVLPAILFAMWAQFNVKSTFSKYSKVSSPRGMTGRDAARLILDRNGLSDVAVVETPGELTDHFDPRANVVRLSSSTYNQKNAAAVGVAAHECGHVIQRKEGYFPMRIRSAIIPITQIGSNLAFPLVLLGLIFSMTSLAYAGIVLFGASVLFQLVTLPVEIDASRRALQCLENTGMITTEDGLDASRKTLRAAAMTYVAATFVALANMLRLIALVNRRRD